MSNVLAIVRRLPLLLVPLLIVAVGGEARAGEHLVVYELGSPEPTGLSAQIAPGLAGCAAGCATLRIPSRSAVPARRQAVLQYAAPAGTAILDAQVRLRVRTRQAGVVAKVQARYGGRWVDQTRIRAAQQTTRSVTAGRGASAVAVALVAESAIARGAVRSDADNAVTVEAVVLRVRDTSPPELRWGAEALGDGWRRGVLCASLAATDLGLGVDRLEYAIGAAVAVAAAPSGGRLQPRPEAYEAAPCIDTAQLPDGAYGTSASAVDGTGDGNRTSLAGSLVRVDNTPPQAELTGPADPEARLPELRLATADAASGVARVEVAVNGIPVSDETVRGELRFVPPQPLADGLHLVTWRVDDAAGNRSEGQQVIAIRDQTAPTIAEAAPTGSASATAEVRARVTDAGAGVAVDGVRVAVDGLDMTAAASFANGDLRLRHPLGWPVGEHVVQLVALDRSGNRAQTSWAFTVPAPPVPPPAPLPTAPPGADPEPPASVAEPVAAAAPSGARLVVPQRLRLRGPRGTLLVRVEIGSAPADGVAVIAQRPNGRRVGAGVTGPDGTARIAVPRSAAGRVVVLAAGAEAEVAVEAGGAVRLKALRTRVAAGAEVRLLGSAPAGRRVAIEARAGGRWVAVVRVAAGADGAFATPVRLPAAGVYTVRARVGADLSEPLRLTAR